MDNKQEQDVITEELQEKIEANLYTIYDKVSEKSGPVTEAFNDQSAARSIQQVPTIMATPQDFILSHVGYRLSDGTILSIPTRVVDYTKPRMVESGDNQ